MYTLVVWNIPKSTCAEDLRGLFAEFGEVVDALLEGTEVRARNLL